MSTVGWVRFVAALMPLVRELLRALFERTGGDVERAKVELRAIRDHGADLDVFEANLRERLEELKRQRGAS